MALFEAAGSMPVWSYWFWGMVGVFMLIMFVPTFRMKDRVTGKITYFWEELIPIAIGLFHSTGSTKLASFQCIHGNYITGFISFDGEYFNV